MVTDDRFLRASERERDREREGVCLSVSVSVSECVSPPLFHTLTHNHTHRLGGAGLIAEKGHQSPPLHIVSMYVCICYLCSRMYVCMYVCMHVCVCVCVCMYAFVYVCTYILRPN